MCSTPKPKRSVHGKAQIATGGILSTMSSKQRLRFAELANTASQLRVEKKRQAKAIHANNQVQLKVRKQKKTNKSKVENSWLYWILSISVIELLKKAYPAINDSE